MVRWRHPRFDWNKVAAHGGSCSALGLTFALRAEAYALPIDDRFPSFDVFSPAHEPALA